LVRKNNFSVGIRRKENYDVVFGDIVSYHDDFATEITPVRFSIMVDTNFHFDRDPKNYKIPVKEGSVDVSVAVYRRVSKGFREFLLNEVRNLDIPLGDRIEVKELSILVFPTFHGFGCDVEIFVKFDLETEMKTADIYRAPGENMLYRLADYTLTSKFKPLSLSIKRWFTEKLTQDNWFEKLVTKEIPIYEEGTKLVLKTARIAGEKTHMWFGVEGRRNVGAIIEFEIPVPKDIGDALMSKGDEREIVSDLIVYLTMLGEGPYEFGDEKVPIKVQMYKPTQSTQKFQVGFDNLVYALTNYQKYGFERQETYSPEE